MAKPIVLLGLGKYTPVDSIEKIGKNLESKIGQDYYGLVYRSNCLDDLQMQVFYEKDFNEVKYEELKKIIEEAVKD